MKNKLLDLLYSYSEFNKQCNRRIILANKLYHRGKYWKILGVILHKFNRRKFNIEIYPHCIIGEDLYIPHCVGIVIGKTAEIGNKCIIFPNVVIGAKYSPFSINPNGRRHAKIGDNCTIGAGAKILGNISIGDNVTIAANTIVSIDVPSNSIVKNVNEIMTKRCLDEDK